MYAHCLKQQDSSSPRGSSSSAALAPLRHTEDFRKDSCSHITEHPQIDGAGAWRLPMEAMVNQGDGCREGGECLQGTEEQRKGVNAINPGCNWKEGMEGETSSCRCQDRGSHHKILASSGLNPFRLFALWGLIAQYTFNSFAGWNHAFPHGPSGLQAGK